MNQKRRAEISGVIAEIFSAKIDVESILTDEQACLDNMPENLEGSERYERIENAVDKLDEAVDSLQDAIDSLGEAME